AVAVLVDGDLEPGVLAVAGGARVLVDDLPQLRARLADEAVHAARGVEEQGDLDPVVGVRRAGRADGRRLRARRGGGLAAIAEGDGGGDEAERAGDDAGGEGTRFHGGLLAPEIRAGSGPACKASVSHSASVPG